MQTLVAAVIVGLLVVLYYTYPRGRRVQFTSNIYRFEGSGPHILLIGTQHGNEPGPGVYLQAFADTLMRRNTHQFNLTIIPVANPAAKNAGTRTAGAGAPDMNRSWHSGHASIVSPYIGLVDSADLVVDMHEGWGFNSCTSASVGNTVWANSYASSYTPQLDAAVSRLNDMYRYGDCRKWSRLEALPPVGGGTLGKYCSARGKPYILVEVAGQSDIQSLDTRVHQSSVVVSSLLGGSARSACIAP